MKCPTCDREIYEKESGPDRGKDGIIYDWKKYHCEYNSCNTFVETWTPQKK